MGQILGECRFLFDMLQKWRRIFVRPARTRQNGGRREKTEESPGAFAAPGQSLQPAVRAVEGNENQRSGHSPRRGIHRNYPASHVVRPLRQAQYPTLRYPDKAPVHTLNICLSAMSAAADLLLCI